MLTWAGALFCLQALASAPVPVAPAASAPDEVARVQPQAQLRGRSLLRFLGMDIYEARLWTDAHFALARYAQHPFALELEYRRSLSGHLIARRSVAEMRRQGDFSAEQTAQWEARMQALFPDVQAGDRITGIYAPGVGARFLHNGRLLGEANDPLFARLFFGIWLSPETSEPQMRCALAACTP